MTPTDPNMQVAVTTDWTPVSLMWSQFVGGMSGGSPVTVTGDNITGLQWNVALQYVLDPAAMGDAGGAYIPMAADLLVNIDDVQFIP